MGKVFAFLADGSEEVELLAVVDILKRGGQEVTLVSVTGKKRRGRCPSDKNPGGF